MKLTIEIETTVEGRSPTRDEIMTWVGSLMPDVIVSEQCGAGEAFALIVDAYELKIQSTP